MKRKFMVFLLVLSMVLSMAPSAFAAEPASSNESLKLGALEDYSEYLPADAVEDESEDAEVTWNMAIAYLLRKAGMEETQLGEYPGDYIGMADSLGMISYDENRNFEAGVDEITVGEFEDLSDNEGLLALTEAMAAETKEPLFVNGMAQPIFPFTSGAVKEGYNSDEAYSNADSDIIRFSVYVETDYDTDGDGKLDLVKALVQLPRAAAEGDFEAATIYEARPYITGCTNRGFGYGDGGELDWDPYTNKVGTNDLEYRDSATDVINGWDSAEAFYNEADAADWYYLNPFEEMMDYEDLEWYDYYLVRGFAVVECGGIGTRGSEGFESCGANIEIDAFKCVIEWLNGEEGRNAYTDKEATTSIDAYWSNGKVGMTGRSYAGTTQFGLATTGVEGLETIVPVAGISSWYEYTNSQGISTRTNVAYTNTLAAYCAGRYLDSQDAEDLYNDENYADTYGRYKRTDDFETIRENYTNFLGQLRDQQVELNGDYSSDDYPDNDTWEIRNYTLDADEINCSALIVHGLNDYNVRPKMFEQMYNAFKENGNDVKLLLHQDGHLTPTYPAGGYVFDIGEDTYDEILNRWFCYYLYDVDNDANDMPEVTAQDAHEVGKWNTYKSYESAKSVILTADKDAEDTTTISSDYSLVGANTSNRWWAYMFNWKDALTEDSTDVSAMYTMPVDEEFTIKGAAKVSFSATTSNVEPEVMVESEVMEEPEVTEEPRESVEPTEAVEPTEPTEAAEPEVMEEPTEPTEAAEPTESEEPTEVVEPTEAVEPEVTEEPTEPVAPNGENPRGKKAEVIDHDLEMATLEDEFEMITMFAAGDTPIEDRDALMVSAMLVDIAPEDETFDVFQTSGSYVPTEMLDEGGAWMGGGLKNFDLKIHKTKEVSYNIITRGWMDLANPDAGWDSDTASEKVTLGEDEYEYTIYLQPTVYEVAEGHTLALVLFTYEPGMVNYSQNYCITFDNASVEADIPVDGKATSSSSSSKKKTKKYDVTIKNADNGDVEVDDDYAKSGQEITITVHPDKGYELDELTITDWNGDEVDYEKGKKENTFVFDMPKSDVTIKVSFDKASSAANDVDDEVADTSTGDDKVAEPIILTIGSTIASVFGENVVNDVAPEIVNDRTMLPVRFVVEALGGSVAWDEAAQKVTVTLDKTVIEIFIGQPFATVNGTPVQLDAPAFIANDRTYLPLRFVAENLGATVTWNEATREVTIVPGE